MKILESNIADISSFITSFPRFTLISFVNHLDIESGIKDPVFTTNIKQAVGIIYHDTL